MVNKTAKPELILVEKTARTGRIVLNQEQVLNPLSQQNIAECRQALDQFRTQGVFVVELTGAGRAFCAGADLGWVDGVLKQGQGRAEERYENSYAALGDAQELVKEIHTFPGIVVAVVNGPAVGGGAGLALAADITVAAKSAYFSLPFVPKLGLIPDLGAVSFLQDRIGTARTMAHSLLGEPIDAAYAADSGLIWACWEDGELQTKARELIARIAELPRSAAVEVKQLVNGSRGCVLHDYLELERGAQARLFGDSETLGVLNEYLAQHGSRVHPAKG